MNFSNKNHDLSRLFGKIKNIQRSDVSKSTKKQIFPICFAIYFMLSSGVIGQNLKSMQNDSKQIIPNQAWTQDEQDVKATIEQFLVAAGNYDHKAIAEIIIDNANIGIARERNGAWSTQTMRVSEFLELLNIAESQPYFEPVVQFSIHISDGHLAIAKADAILYRYGMPLYRNFNNFTLLKENGAWKFVNLSYSSTQIPDNEKKFDIEAFAKGYAQAWCSQKPNFVASFYAEDGSLNINNGTPSVGRTAITQSAKSFMDAFPDDMIVAFDKLVKTKKGIEFHWTLTGTNTGPNGTGKKLNISGFELWKLDDNGLIKESKGSFDEVEYMLQLNEGL